VPVGQILFAVFFWLLAAIPVELQNRRCGFAHCFFIDTVDIFMNFLNAVLLFTLFIVSSVVVGAEEAAKPKPKPTLSIIEYRITGNTLLNPVDIERVLEPFLGPGQEVSAIEKAAKKIEKLYKDKGYPTVFVNIPEQDIRDGVVAMSIVEGKVRRVQISGAEHYTLSGIRQAIPALEEGKALYFPDFQRQLSRVNSRSQHLKVTPVLKPGKSPGTVDVELKVKDELPLVNQLTLNNYNSANTTRPRVEFNTAYNNLWQKDHGVSLQYQFSPENTKEVRIFGITYLMPTVGQHRAAVYFVDSDSQVANLGGQTAFTALGKGQISGLRYIIPLQAFSSNSALNYLHSLTWAFDYKDFADTLEIAGDKTKEEPNLRQDLAPVNYGLFGFDYDVTFMHGKGTNRLSLGSRWGIRGLNEDKEFEAKRRNAEPNFAYYTLGATTQRDFAQGWQWRVRTKAQLTDSLLIGNEQFSIGGNETVRGYFQSETLGDTGVYAQAEIRTPVLFTASWLSDLRALAFVDAGEVAVRSPLPGQAAHTTLGAAGLGARVKLKGNFTLGVEAAHALKDGTKTANGDWRLDGQLRWQF
jgi:hemolysin activation/secretion protein